MSRTLALVFLLASSAFVRAETPKIDSLHTQRKGDAVYFVVCLRPSRDWGKWDLEASDRRVRYEAQRRRLARLPRLVPQDDFTRAVYLELDPLPAEKGNLPLRFVGKTHDKRKANLLLIYPATKAAGGKMPPLRKRLAPSGWVETPLTLDFRQATAMKPFTGTRNTDGLPATEDLEGRWAAAQAGQLAILETQTRDFSFFGLARTLTGRKYQVPATSFVAENTTSKEKAAQQLFEMTTGAAALAESLALARSGWYAFVSARPAHPHRNLHSAPD